MKLKIGSDIIKVYKDVHTWAGIVCGLMLFIAFYAGAITMFEKPLERWATPPSQLAEAPPLEDAEKLLAAVLEQYPGAARRYSIVVTPTPDQPARLVFSERGNRPRELVEYGASFAADGSLQVQRLRAAKAAQVVDRMHQYVGLPFPDPVAKAVMGVGDGEAVDEVVKAKSSLLGKLDLKALMPKKDKSKQPAMAKA